MSDGFASNPEWVFMLCAFWQGFSAAILVAFALLCTTPYFSNYNIFGMKKKNDLKPEPLLWERLIISVPAIAGLLGAVLSLGAIRFSGALRAGDHGSYMISFALLGSLIGFMYALFLKKKLS